MRGGFAQIPVQEALALKWRVLKLAIGLGAGAFSLCQTSLLAAPTSAPAPIRVPASLQWGAAKKGSVLTRQIAIENPSSVTAEQITVDSSCSCTQILSAPTRLKPHEAGVVSLRYAPDKAGDARIEVLVRAKVSGKTLISQIAATASISENGKEAGSEFSLPEIEAQAALKEASLTLVDLRSAREYANAHIPGSLNIPLFALKAQDFLKTRRILLVNDGLLTPAIQEEAGRLGNAGFVSVRFLSGGVRAWQWAGGQVEGRSPETVRLLGVDRLMEAEKNRAWDCVFVTSKQDSDKLSQAVKGQQGAAPAHQTFVIAAEREQYRQLEASLSGSKTPFLYFDGTINDWIRFHANLMPITPVASIVIGSSPTHALSIRSGKGSPCKTCSH